MAPPRRRRRAAAVRLVAAAVTLTIGDAACSPGRGGASHDAPVVSPEPVGTLGHAGRWIVDDAGRAVILHGLNEVPKGQPGYAAAFGFGDADAAFLAANGFDAVRLGVNFADLEPEPGRIDIAYLDQVRATVAALDRHGVYTLIDFHQDCYAPVFLGPNPGFNAEGFPPWATLTKGLPAGPPQACWRQYLLNHALESAFESFWANAPTPAGPIQDVYAHAVAVVATAFADDPHLLGYDVFNEPWPGIQYPACYSSRGCGALERHDLVPFYRRVLTAVRAVDPRHLVFVEPFLSFDDTEPSFLPALGDPATVFAFHTYCAASGGGTGAEYAGPAIEATCGPLERRNLAYAQAAQAGNGMGLMNTEWGDSVDPTLMDRMVAEFDAARVGWMYWAYDDCCFEPESNNSVKLNRFRPPSAPNVDDAKLSAIEEPYPLVVAGTPMSWSFDRVSRRFRLRFSTARAAGGGAGGSGGAFAAGSVSVVFVPPLQYPGGYAVALRGARVISAAGGPRLVIASLPGATTVSVDVTPLH